MNNSQKKIMIVDDSPSANALLEMILSNEKYSVVSFDNGLDAVESIKKTPPDLVIMDTHMPKLDGIEATKRIKNNVKTAQIPIIIISGQDQQEEISKAMEAGADDYMIKPYDFQVLLRNIKETLE